MVVVGENEHVLNSGVPHGKTHLLVFTAVSGSPCGEATIVTVYFECRSPLVAEGTVMVTASTGGISAAHPWWLSHGYSKYQAQPTGIADLHSKKYDNTRDVCLG